IGERCGVCHDFVYVIGNSVVPDGEVKFLRHSARHRDHRHLAFPGLTEPALLREFLNPASALAGGVVPVEHYPEISGNKNYCADNNPGNPHPAFLATSSALVDTVEIIVMTKLILLSGLRCEVVAHVDLPIRRSFMLRCRRLFFSQPRGNPLWRAS